MSQENVEIVRGTRIALPPLSERASQRRALDERLFVRFPALYRLLADALMRLPPRSRLQRLMIARGIRQAYAAANRRDFDRILVGWDPGSEYRPSGDLMPPDFEAVFYGHDGYRKLWRYFSSPGSEGLAGQSGGLPGSLGSPRSRRAARVAPS